MADRSLTTVAAEELLGYAELTQLPESTGTEKLVLKKGNLFAVTGRLGDIFPPGARDQGAYFEDTRFLSKLKLTVAGGPPVVLSSQSTSEYRSQVDLTVTSTSFGGLFADPVNFLHLRREQLVDEQLVERLTLTNFLVHDIDYWVEYEFACDFADQFEVRGARRRSRGTFFLPRVTKDRVTFAYQTALNRPPAAEERQDCAEFLQKYRAKLTALKTPADQLEPLAWAALARALMSANEFVFVD